MSISPPSYKQNRLKQLRAFCKTVETKNISRAAEKLFLTYDEIEDFETLGSYLAYVHFDPKPFPNLMKAMAGQGMEDRAVIDLPYRCNR